MRKYVYGSPYIDELACKIEVNGGETRMYYLQDANYKVVALAGSNGDVDERCWYEPYGTVTFTDETGTENTPCDESDYENTLTFQGRRWDEDVDLYYFRNRWYSAELGRFLQRDPAGYVDGMGLYEFVGGKPLIALDAYGLKAKYLGSGILWQESVRLPSIRYGRTRAYLTLDITAGSILIVDEQDISDLNCAGAQGTCTFSVQITHKVLEKKCCKNECDSLFVKFVHNFSYKPKNPKKETREGMAVVHCDLCPPCKEKGEVPLAECKLIHFEGPARVHYSGYVKK